MHWERQREAFLNEHAYDVGAIYWPAPMALRLVGARGYHGFSILVKSHDATANDQVTREAERLFPESEDVSHFYPHDDFE